MTNVIYHTIALAAGFLLDLIFGDPRWLYHPVCLIGNLISVLEKGIRRIFPKTNAGELAGGVVETILVCLFSFGVPAVLLSLLYGHFPVAGVILETFWCYQLLATRSLKDESMKVYDRLVNGTIEEARYAVSMIVGRDTQELTDTGVTKAAVETVAENCSDGVIAPMIDADPQGSLTASLGYVEPDEIGTTLATIMMAIINEKEFEITDGILHHKENVDLLPANIELSALEVTMGNVMSRELIMKEYIEAVRTKYDYILIDCMPSLGLMTINALVAADSVLIPVQAAYLPVKGLQQLIHTIAMVKKRLNRQLIFEGILLTMVDFRTNYAKDVAGKVRESYGEKIEIFDTVIPMSVKAAETSAEGVSIFSHCLNGKVAKAYETIAKEVLGNEE